MNKDSERLNFGDTVIINIKEKGEIYCIYCIDEIIRTELLCRKVRLFLTFRELIMISMTILTLS